MAVNQLPVLRAKQIWQGPVGRQERIACLAKALAHPARVQIVENSSSTPNLHRL